MPKDDRETFEYLLGLKDTSREVSFITYAVFAQERSEWIKHVAARNGSSPTQADIDNWIADITDYQFTAMRDRAVNMFDEAAVLICRTRSMPPTNALCVPPSFRKSRQRQSGGSNS